MALLGVQCSHSVVFASVTFDVAVHYLGVVDFGFFWEDIPFQCMGTLMDEWAGSHRLHRWNG